MEKAKYEVYAHKKVPTQVYVTTTRNTEDMIKTLCDMYNNPKHCNFIIWRTTESEGRVKVYHSTRKSYPHESISRRCRTRGFEGLCLPD